jgi:hypothetical protein
VTDCTHDELRRAWDAADARCKAAESRLADAVALLREWRTYSIAISSVGGCHEHLHLRAAQHTQAFLASARLTAPAHGEAFEAAKTKVLTEHAPLMAAQARTEAEQAVTGDEDA